MTFEELKNIVNTEVVCVLSNITKDSDICSMADKISENVVNKLKDVKEVKDEPDDGESLYSVNMYDEDYDFPISVRGTYVTMDNGSYFIRNKNDDVTFTAPVEEVSYIIKE